MSAEPTDELYDLPPSAKLVYKTLQAEGTLTQKQLVAHTLLSPRTVRYALTELKEIDAVDEDVSFRDARQKLYSVPPREREEARVSH